MSEEKKLPIFLGEGEDRLQIGEAIVEPWHQQPEFTHLSMRIDVFMGETATLSRVFKMEEVKAYSEARYHKKEGE